MLRQLYCGSMIQIKRMDLFDRALERGILHSQNGVYSISIPSLHTWLISNYMREKIEFSSETKVSIK